MLHQISFNLESGAFHLTFPFLVRAILAHFFRNVTITLHDQIRKNILLVIVHYPTIFFSYFVLYCVLLTANGPAGLWVTGATRASVQIVGPGCLSV